MDPRLTLFAAGAATIGSERVRKVVGRGLGYATAGVVKVGGPVVRPVVDAGRDIVDEARETASSNGTARRSNTRRKS